MGTETYIQVAYKAAPYTTDLESLQKSGVQVTKLGGIFQLFSTVMDTLFRDRVDSEIFSRMKQGISDSKMKFKPNVRSFINIYDERRFEEFCALGVGTTFEDKATDSFEKTVNSTLIFTDDPGFDQSKIPFVIDEKEFNTKYTNKLLPYKTDYVYLLKMVSSVQQEGVLESMEEYVIYIPSKLMNNYE